MSTAYQSFLESLILPESLLQLEIVYPDPPKLPQEVKNVEALRGGATVLIVASFESFLRDMIEENLDRMRQSPITFKLNAVPEKMRRENIEGMISKIEKMAAETRIGEYELMAQIIVNKTINPESFTDIARSNPNSENVKKLFKCLGITNVFESIKREFDIEWGSSTTKNFIEDTLNTIVQRRHIVAHEANALNISRMDLGKWIKFIKILASLCNKTMKNHIDSMF